MQDRPAHAVAVLQDLMVPEPEDPEPHLFEIPRAPVVVGDLPGVVTAIQLDDQRSLVAKKIHDERPTWDLPLPLPAAEAMGAKGVPEPRLGIGVIAAQLAGAIALSLRVLIVAMGSGWTFPDGEGRSHPSPYPLPSGFASGERKRYARTF
jgi:hypothetical protein